MPKGKPRTLPNPLELAQSTVGPSKLLDITWIGKGTTEEGSKKTFYNAFERSGEKYQLEDFVHVKSPGKSRVIVKITSIWEEWFKRNRYTTLRAFLMGNVFSSASKNGSTEQDAEILPSDTVITCELKDIEGKCIVKNKEDIRNLKNFSQRPNHYCLSPIHDRGQKREESLLPDAPPKRARSESPNKLSKAKKRKLNQLPKNGENHLALTPDINLNGPIEDGNDSSSDEERSYRRSLKRRLAFEQQERQANREQREKWEQQSINNRFFKSSGRRNSDGKGDQQTVHQLQNLVEANLFNTRSIVPSELLEQKIEVEGPRMELATPGWKIVEDYEDNRDPKIDGTFYRNYKLGLLKEPEEAEKKKQLWKKDSKLTHVRKIFDPNRWIDEEVALFKELLCAFGQDWNKISSLMLSKQPLQLEEYYVNNRYDLTCELCGSTSDDDQLLLCDGCDRAYHTYCLIPPLKAVPKQAWYCTRACEKLHQKKCELCKSLEDDQNMILCDSCDKGFHIYCLDPPLKEIPPDEWFCESCKPIAKENNRKTLATALNALTTPEGIKLRALRKNSKKLTKRAEIIADSLSTSLTYNDLKRWAVSCLEDPPILLRESNLALIDHISIFGKSETPPDVTDDKLGEHFDALLLAGEIAVDRMIKNPIIEAKVTEIPIPDYNPVPAEIENLLLLKSSKPTIKEKEKDINDGYGVGSRSWIFQANAGIYDIVNSLKSLKKMTWFVKQHIHKIKNGDRVYIWVSGKDAGILAAGTVLTDPKDIPEDRAMKKFFVTTKHFNSSQLRVIISIDYLMPKRIEKSVFVNHSTLSHLTILRQPIGTNFKLTKSEAMAIEKVILAMFGKVLNTEYTSILETEEGESTPPSKKKKIDKKDKRLDKKFNKKVEKKVERIVKEKKVEQKMEKEEKEEKKSGGK